MTDGWPIQQHVCVRLAEYIIEWFMEMKSLTSSENAEQQKLWDIAHWIYVAYLYKIEYPFFASLVEFLHLHGVFIVCRT